MSWRLTWCPRVAIPAAVIAIMMVESAWTAPALASVTVELSPEATDAFNANGGSARATTRQLQRDFNRGLEELGKTDVAAKALFESGQKLRIVCFGTKEAEDAGLRPGIGLYGGGGETKGDFDSNGNPKPGGTAIIAIDCGTLRAVGMQTRTVPSDPNSTMYRILIHELLHASNAARRHPPDELAIYDQFVQAFEAALQRAIARPRDQRTSSVEPVPRSPTQGTSAAAGTVPGAPLGATAPAPAGSLWPRPNYPELVGTVSNAAAWNGVFVGLNVGGTLGQNDTYDLQGGSVGVHAGFGKTFGTVYFGIEGGLTHATLSGARERRTTQTLTQDVSASLLGRAGFVYGDMLFYGVGGATFGHTELVRINRKGEKVDAQWLVAPTLGIGLEKRFAPKVTGGIRYTSEWYPGSTFFDMRDVRILPDGLDQGLP